MSLLALGAVFGVLGLYLLWRGGGAIRDAYRIGTGSSLSGGAAPTTGPVDLEGTAHPVAGSDPVTTPVSNEPSLLWESRLQRYRATRNYGRPDSQWETVDTDAQGRPFVVDCGSVRAEVDPETATLSLGEWQTETTKRGSVEPSTSDSDLPLAMISTELWLLKLADDTGSEDELEETAETETETDPSSPNRPTSIDIEHRLRVQERRLEPGDPVYVYGGRIESRSTEWGAETNVTVGGDDESRYLITSGDASTAAWSRLRRGIAFASLGCLSLILAVLLWALAW
ncbi:hypothetical protein [Natronorubrum texcoconense]|uniref:Uncharacterized protein n=1 Tax=Natronorubrum texcoconense TaxID=1095776 RepID=A0A1G8YEW0_9EURY|nr:hypothetical protein [Natronorubrum texcoconense]SDK01251.1 hypothetical protein SAMN04515672_2134 [Natronorubrum texcoconense]